MLLGLMDFSFGDLLTKTKRFEQQSQTKWNSDETEWNRP